MLSQNIAVCFAFLVSLLTTQTLAQCPDTFFQCSAPDGAGTLDYGDLNGLLSSLDGAADVSIDKLKLLRRQDLNGVCCNPSTQCLVTQGVPFCYSKQSTGFFFPDGSYGYTANDTLYAADGTLLYNGGSGQATSVAVATPVASQQHSVVASPTPATPGLTTKSMGVSSPAPSSQAGAQHAGHAGAVSVELNRVILVAGISVVWTIGLFSIFN